jgi:aspartate aminotransferase
MLAQNEDVIRFDIGEPDFDTPAHIKEAGIAAIRSGFTHYTSGRGIPELRDALVGDQRSKGLDAGPSNIAFYPGSKLGLFCALSLLVDRGDEVLVQDPVWPSYGSIVEYLGGRPVEVQSWKDDQPSMPIAETFESRITDKTQAVIINTPCNPTGAIVGYDSLEELVRVCTARKVTLILDRIYSALTYDGSPEKIPSANLEDGYFVVVSGFSKEFAMTGWRLGYTIASRALTDALVNLQDNTSTCAPSFVQKAGVAALTGDRGWQKAMNSEYRARRDLMVDGIRKVPGWNCQPPQGAFYCFPRVADSESIALADSLLSKKKVSSVAGAYFGSSGESHLRLSYTTSRDRIAEGMKRIRDLVEGQGPV